jgi:hypothetical protein
MMRSQAILHRNARIEESEGIVEGVGSKASEWPNRSRKSEVPRPLPEVKVFKYAPVLTEVQIAGGWAIEVGDADASYRMSARDEPVTANEKARYTSAEAAERWFMEIRRGCFEIAVSGAFRRITPALEGVAPALSSRTRRGLLHDGIGGGTSGRPIRLRRSA